MDKTIGNESGGLISIVIPAYNEEKYIGAAIESVLQQPYQNIEVLVVNDASTDRTSETARAYEKKDARVKVFDPGKLGKNGAFNFGIAKSKGEWVCLLGGDDFIGDRFFVQAIAAVAALDPLTQKIFVGGGQKTFTMDSKYQYEHDITIAPPDLNAPFANTLGIASAALAKEVFPVPLGYPNEDGWTALCYRYLSEVRFDIPEIYVHYRIHEGNSYDHNGDFATYNKAYHVRRIVLHEFCERHGAVLKQDQLILLQKLYEVELLRYKGKTLSILCVKGAPMMEKIKAAVFSSAVLNKLKIIFGRFLLSRKH